jgi:dTDP-4-dehydrorhamnose 3,5-epimerase
MKVLPTELVGVYIIEPAVFGDHRGFFMETHNQQRFRENHIDSKFVQDNLSYSGQNTLRGLHYQLPQAQAKLIQVVTGKIYDVAVDIRKGSPTFGKWVGFHLSDENHRQLLVSEGFAHGFCVLSETAHVIYKCTDFYSPENEKGVLWSDPDLSIDWPVREPILSEKDQTYSRLSEIPPDHLFKFESQT